MLISETRLSYSKLYRGKKVVKISFPAFWSRPNIAVSKQHIAIHSVITPAKI